ncbi:hypothetical protein MAM1_0001d00016 [Mucor ambiguus]|uniref:Uncharacterized protein n=1 Tax=Mucor ambiguus TaxID=91626 RepID=A0A0C9M3F1_9FUNG|nr:hypothetical protein MAM1_0001d00016 [Mucor ambiguus]
MLSLGKLLLFATAVFAVYLLSWCLLSARCCCDCRPLAVLVMLSLGNLVLAFAVCFRSLDVLMLSTAAAAVHLLSLSGRCTLLVLTSAAAATVHLLCW